jgi:hypothetical protein
LRKKGIKGTSKYGPAKEHPYFGRIQWNQSQSHMPKGLRVPAPAANRVEAEPMEAKEPTTQQGREEGPVVMGHSKYQFLCDEMSFFLLEIADIKREDREDQYLAN